MDITSTVTQQQASIQRFDKKTYQEFKNGDFIENIL